MTDIWNLRLAITSHCSCFWWNLCRSGPHGSGRWRWQWCLAYKVRHLYWNLLIKIHFLFHIHLNSVSFENPLLYALHPIWVNGYIKLTYVCNVEVHIVTECVSAKHRFISNADLSGFDRNVKRSPFPTQHSVHHHMAPILCRNSYISRM